jgi:hypothetical protein
MVGTIFKGDVAEVSWGKETGLMVTGTGSATGFTHTSTSDGSSVITVGTATYWHTGSGTVVEIPDNALVGCIVRITGGSNFSSDDYASTRRAYYITANDTTTGTITVQPALVTGTTVHGAADDLIILDSLRSPTFESAMTDAAQQVKTDQFFGLLDNFSLPEPEIDVRKQHIVGMGRDVNVLTSGRETLAGGSFALNAHTLRWMRYALGGHVAKSKGEFVTLSDNSGGITGGEQPLNIAAATKVYQAQQYGTADTDTLSAVSSSTLTGTSSLVSGDHVLVGAKTNTSTDAASVITLLTDPPADTHVSVDATNGGIFKTLSGTGEVLFGSYTGISTLNLTGAADIDTGALARAVVAGNTVYLLAPLTAAVSRRDVRVKVGATIRALFTAGDYIQIIDKDTHSIPGQDATLPTVFKNEIRRVIAVDGDYVYVEEPFFFAHAIGSAGVERLQYTTSDSRGSPNIGGTTKELQFGVEHTLFGDTALPTFMIEQSFRRDNATPGSEQLLRLYNGCKVNSLSFSANTEGEIKLQVEYEGGRHYTDTANAFTPHRMFENTANTAINRKASGIAINGEKPYLFQDLNFEVFGRPVLRATQVEFGISNSNQARHFIRGYSGNTTDNDQVQLAGVQMPLDITEAQREYTFSFSAMIEDDQLWEQIRTRKHHQNTNDITLTMKKRGSNSTRENATITIEDYTIVKADHQIPDDKGAVIVQVELAVRHLKVVENSPYFTL